MSSAELRDLIDEQKELLRRLTSTYDYRAFQAQDVVVVTMGRFLAPHALASAMAVCRRWRSLLSSDLVWEARFRGSFGERQGKGGNLVHVGPGAGGRPAGWMAAYRAMQEDRAAFASSALSSAATPRNLPAGHRSSVTCVATHGTHVVSGDSQGAILLWSLPALSTPLRKFRGNPTPPVTALAISLQGKRLAAGGADGSVRVFSLPSASFVSTAMVFGAAVVSLAFHNGDELLACGSVTGHVISLQAESLAPHHQPRLATGATSGSQIVSLAASAGTDAAYAVAAGLSDGAVNLAGGTRPERTLIAHDGAVSAVALSAVADELVSGSADRSIKVWDLAALDRGGAEDLSPIVVETDSAVESLVLKPFFLFAGLKSGNLVVMERATLIALRTIPFFAGKPVSTISLTSFPGVGGARMHAITACSAGDKVPSIKSQLFNQDEKSANPALYASPYNSNTSRRINFFTLTKLAAKQASTAKLNPPGQQQQQQLVQGPIVEEGEPVPEAPRASAGDLWRRVAGAVGVSKDTIAQVQMQHQQQQQQQQPQQADTSPKKLLTPQPPQTPQPSAADDSSSRLSHTGRSRTATFLVPSPTKPIVNSAQNQAPPAGTASPEVLAKMARLEQELAAIKRQSAAERAALEAQITAQHYAQQRMTAQLKEQSEAMAQLQRKQQILASPVSPRALASKRGSSMGLPLLASRSSAAILPVSVSARSSAAALPSPSPSSTVTPGTAKRLPPVKLHPLPPAGFSKKAAREEQAPAAAAPPPSHRTRIPSPDVSRLIGDLLQDVTKGPAPPTFRRPTPAMKNAQNRERMRQGYSPFLQPLPVQPLAPKGWSHLPKY